MPYELTKGITGTHIPGRGSLHMTESQCGECGTGAVENAKGGRRGQNFKVNGSLYPPRSQNIPCYDRAKTGIYPSPKVH